jgi:hypothetical protein
MVQRYCKGRHRVFCRLYQSKKITALSPPAGPLMHARRILDIYLDTTIYCRLCVVLLLPNLFLRPLAFHHE